jgi:(p)ppGpp synthase/HD superfamily hydrolase
MNIVERASKFAKHAHRNQRRKYTHEPYFVHLHEVAQICARHGGSKRSIAAAYLHDVIEDQPITHEQLVSEFGREVADIVRELTDAPASAGTRKDRKATDVARLAAAGAEPQTIKCADLISNTSSIVKYDPAFARIYLTEKRAMLDVLTRADKTLHALAMRSLIEADERLGNSGEC